MHIGGNLKSLHTGVSVLYIECGKILSRSFLPTPTSTGLLGMGLTIDLRFQIEEKN